MGFVWGQCQGPMGGLWLCFILISSPLPLSFLSVALEENEGGEGFL